MFDIGWSELLVIGVVAIVVVGPKDLPRLMRTFGSYTGRARRMAADFQRQFEEAVRDTEIEEVRKAMQDLRNEAATPIHLDTPLMVPKEPPAASGADPAPVPALPGPTPAPEATSAAKKKPKPRAKRAAKPDTAAAGAAGNAAPKTRKPRKPKP